MEEKGTRKRENKGVGQIPVEPQHLRREGTSIDRRTRQDGMVAGVFICVRAFLSG